MANRYVSQQTFVEVYARQDGLCGGCGEDLLDTSYENHHMKRVADGGEDTTDNLVLLCPDCHQHYHAFNTRLELETPPDQYPFFEGKTDDITPPEQLEDFADEQEIFETIEETSDIDEGNEAL